jgi:ribonuclease P protein component
VQSFTPAHRLKKADEFSSVFLFKKVRFGVYLKIHFKPNGLENSRLGLVVGKKVHKRANKRNYMKRLIRELFRTNQPNWNTSYDVIVRVHKLFTPETFSTLQTEFLSLTKLFNK